MIVKKFEDLPEAIQNVYMSKDIEAVVMDIGQENGLHIDQIGMLMEEIKSVLIGLLDREKFISEIKHTLDIEQDVAEKVTIDINKYIFDPLREELMGLTNPVPTPATTAPVTNDIHADEIMNAISNPSSIPSPTRMVESPAPVATPAVPRAAPIQQPVPTAPDTTTNVVPVTTTQPSTLPAMAVPLPAEVTPHELKLAESVHIAPTTTDSAIKTASLIPPEIKERINKDPYKEAI